RCWRWAQRPLPSMMIATCRGNRSAGRSASGSIGLESVALTVGGPAWCGGTVSKSSYYEQFYAKIGNAELDELGLSRHRDGQRLGRQLHRAKLVRFGRQ